MPLNVIDNKGKHLGVIKKRFSTNNENIFMVALTTMDINELDFELDNIKHKVAEAIDATSLFGRINEEKFERKLNEIIEMDTTENLAQMSDDNIIKYMYLKYTEDKFNLLIRNVKGYLLYDMNHAVIKGNQLVIEDEIDYINEEEVLEEDRFLNYDSSIQFESNTNIQDEKKSQYVPIFCRISDLPILETEIMGIEGFILGADLMDLGGNNHIHSTRIIAQSGNYEDRLGLPIHVYGKKGQNLHLYLINDKIKVIMCDGRIYLF